MKMHHLAIGLLACTCTGGTAAFAQPYFFVNYADSNGSFATFVGGPSLNASGVVAFRSTLDSGVRGIFTSSGGAATTIADSDGPLSTFTTRPAINAGGIVAFLAGTDDGGEGIFTGNGGSLTLIVDSGADETLGGYVDIETPSINDAGTVVFFAFRGNDRRGIYRSVAGGGATGISTDANAPFNVFGFFPGINASGTVAYGRQGNVFTSGPTTNLTPDPPFEIVNMHASAINAAGTVAFVAYPSGGLSGLYTGDGVAPATLIADENGAYDEFAGSYFAINDDGAVAFYAFLDAGGEGIFTGPDPLADRVIGTGDDLFGSTVTELGFHRGLNADGDVAFRYTLADGRSGIAVAVVPEPGGIAVFAAGALIALRRRRLRNT